MRVRRMIVRAINRLRGVDAKKMHEMRMRAGASLASMALHMNVPLLTVLEWEDETSAIMKAQYKKAMCYLYDVASERERKEFNESPVWRD